MNKTALLASAVFLAASGGSVLAAGHPVLVHHGFAKVRPIAPPNKHDVTLYDQNGNDAGVAVVSDNFDSGSFDSYDDQAADDFTVPSLHMWVIRQVNVTGAYFNGSGPADGVTVYFYKDNGGLPGDLIQEVDGSEFTDTNGSFTIKLEDAVALKAGTYWVSVQANINFATAGEWGWEVNSVQNGNLSAWQNPGGGFGVCPVWGTTESCLGYGPDLMFSLIGKDLLKKKDVGGGDGD